VCGYGRPVGTVIPLRGRVPSAPLGPEPLWRTGLGAQLRAERHRRGERLADVASHAGVSTQYLSELERGKKEASSEVVAALAGALGLSVVDLSRRVADRLSALRAGSEHSGPVCLAA